MTRVKMRNMSEPGSCLLACILLIGTLSVAPAVGADEGKQEETVTFNFAESVRITELVDYVSQRTGTRFVYDEAVTGNVILRGPLEVKVSSLLPILRSILDFKGFQMVEAEGLYRIQKGPRAQVAREAGPGEIRVLTELTGELKPDGVYTVLVETQHVDVEDFSNTLKAVTGLSPIVVPKAQALILTDYGKSLGPALDVAKLLDRPRPPLETAVYSFQHVQASQVKDLAVGILQAQVVPALKPGGAPAEGPSLYLDSTANRIVLLVPPERVEKALAVLKALDAAAPVELRSYEIKTVEPQLAATFLKEALRSRAPGLADLIVQPVADRRLLIMATPAVHETVEEVLGLLEQSGDLPLKYYPVEHVEAQRIEVLARILLGLSGRAGGGGEMLMAVPEENMLVARLTEDRHAQLEDILKRFDTKKEAVGGIRTQLFQVRNTSAKELAERLRAILGIAQPVEAGEIAAEASRLLPASTYLGIKAIPGGPVALSSEKPEGATAGPQAPEEQPQKAPAGAAQPAAVRIVADENTNSIVVCAPVEYHETITQLVTYLDRRRPQVLIEATVAFVSASSDLRVAVELMGKTGTALVFTSFGLSTVDVETGTRKLIPATGLNASILDPQGSGAILRALRADAKSRVVAEPRILVNDNAKGRFESIQEEPFTSLSIGQTVSTTTFAGYAEAGLSIEVTPQISEGNFVRLDYTITSRDFTGASAQAGVPPPRKSDQITSSVTVPDGHTAIMGGLVRWRASESADKVPILGSIPLLGVLFRSSVKADTGSRLFVFLRPVILRDDDFSDLKDLSRGELSVSPKRPSGPDSIYPPVKPKVMQ